MKRGMRHPHDPEWLKEIPSAWQVAALRRCVHVESTGSAPIKNTVELAPGPDLVPAFSASGQDVWVAPCQGKRFSGPGLVISAVGARCGKTFFADGVWSVVANTSVLRVRRGNSTRYFWYLLNDEEFWIRGESAQPYVQVQPSLSKKIPVPPLPEQQRIAAFLDRETTKIDSLVAELTGFAETLRARDKSLIAECVTQGVPSRRAGRTMVDSGVEWIGKVPVGWRVAPIRHTVFSSFGHSPEGETINSDGEGVPFMQGSSDFDSRYATPTKWTTSPRKMAASGSILMSVRAPVGAVNLANAPVAIGRGLAEIRGDGTNSCTSFLFYLLQVMSGRLSAISQGTTFEAVSSGPFRSEKVALPSLAEQVQIADYLDAELAKSAALLAEMENQVSLLRAYRKSLVSEAVTGKVPTPG